METTDTTQTALSRKGKRLINPQLDPDTQDKRWIAFCDRKSRAQQDHEQQKLWEGEHSDFHFERSIST